MSYFTDYLRNRRQQGLPMVPLSEGRQPDPRDFMMDGWGFSSAQERENKQKAAQPQPAVELPKVDTSNAIGSLADMLGPTPAEREAQQARLERGRQQMTMWTGLIDGLRQLGNLYYTAKGARPQQFSDPYKMVDETYQREAKRLDDLTAYRRAYANQLYNLQRQGRMDKMQQESHQASLDWRKSQEEALREKTRQQDEKNQAIIRHYDALEKKDTYQAAYWKAKAEGYSDEAASRIAKNYAQGNAAMIKANNAAGGTGKGNKKKKKGDGTTVTPRGWGGSSTGNSTKGKAYN